MRPIFLSFLLLLPIIGIAQNTCLPTSPVTADYPVTENALKSLFELHKPKYTEADYISIRRQIDQCNAGNDRELDGLVSQMSNLSLKYQQVLSYKDVSGLEKQISDLQESRKKSRLELEQNLGYVKHTGIYAVLLEDIDPYENKSTLIAKSNAAISPVAVEDLVGTYMNRVSHVKDFAPVRDVVQAFVGGEAKAEKEYFNQSNFHKNYFLYVAKVGATPLKQKPSGPASSDRILVINLSRDSNFRSRLRSKGVSEENISRIERDVLPYLADVQRDNNAADSRQDDILQRGTEEIRRIDREIDDARNRLSTRSTKINNICKELGVAFDANNIDNSVTTALQTLRKQIQDLTTQWTATKEREIVVKETRTFIEGSPAHHLALEALNTCKQLEQGYGNVDRILQITEVENLEVSRYDANRTLTVYREPQKIWAYPIPLEDGSFRLVVLAQFKVTGQKTDSGLNIGVYRETQSDKDASRRSEKKLDSKFEKTSKPESKRNNNSEVRAKPNEEKDNPFGNSSGIRIGNSIGSGLGGRAVVRRGSINDNSTKSGKVVIEICVDSDGNVTSAAFTKRGSTTSDDELKSKALKAARGYRFAASSADKQCGTITFNFKNK